MEKTKRKDISEKTAVRAIITGFVSYGIIFAFLMIFVIIGLYSIILNVHTKNPVLFTIILSIIISIIIYIVINLICRLANYDLFRKCKVKKDFKDYISRKMNLFYVLCILFFALLTICCISLRNKNKIDSIDLLYRQYYIDISDNHNARHLAAEYRNSLLKDYNKTKPLFVSSIIIIELGIVYSFIRLVPYQRKLLDEYNK